MSNQALVSRDFIIHSSIVIIISFPVQRSHGGGHRRIAASSSSIVTREVRGCHKVTIDGFAASKKTLKGWYWSSQTFQLGGFSWRVRYTPHAGDRGDRCIALHLELDHGASGSPAHVHPVEFSFSLLDPSSGNPVPKFTRATEQVRSFNQSWSQGFTDFIRHEDLEASGCLKDDRFAVACNVTVIRNLNHWPGGKNIDDGEDDGGDLAPAPPARVVVPPSDLHRQLTDLLWKKKEGRDVTISIAGKETFDAHGWLLAARSPVFEAKLLAAAKKEKYAALRYIEIHGVEPNVFKAMLHYMYTDALPPEEEGTDAVAMASGLLAAAKRFKLERLRLMCEETLCKRIDLDTVAETLAAAEQHGCRALKAACVEFITRPGNLKALMATEGFEKMRTTCPGVVMEIVMKQLA